MLSQDQQEKIINALLKRPENIQCADCGAKSPCWASLDFGVFVCMNCSGAHRALGPSITRVKSTKLDSWNRDWLQNMQIGNSIINQYWQNLPVTSKPHINSSQSDINKFVHDKYMKKKFADKSQQHHPLKRMKMGIAVKAEKPVIKEVPKQVTKKEESVVDKQRRKSIDLLMNFDQPKKASNNHQQYHSVSEPKMQQDLLMTFDSNHTEGHNSISSQSSVSHTNNLMDFQSVFHQQLNSSYSNPNLHTHTAHNSFSMPTHQSSQPVTMNFNMNMYPKVLNIHMNSPQNNHYHNYAQSSQPFLQQNQPQGQFQFNPTSNYQAQSNQSMWPNQQYSATHNSTQKTHDFSNTNKKSQQLNFTLDSNIDFSKNTKKEESQKQSTSWADEWK